jgi:uncharacterized protein (TIGR02246 family)
VPPIRRDREARADAVDIRELEQRIEDAWNAKDLERFLSFYDPEHELIAPGFTGKGVQGMREAWNLWNAAFPDNRITTRTTVVEGSTIATESTFQGTHTGTLVGPEGAHMEPTGRSLTLHYATFETARNDRMVRTVFFYDQLEMLDQLGLAEPTGRHASAQSS